MNWPTRVLMVTPEHFDVEYAINPHMKDAQGNLNTIDKEAARKQWQDLKETFENIGQEVVTLTGQKGLPDMVFCANQTFPFLKNGKMHWVLSQMHSPERQPEVAFFKEWAAKNDIPTLDVMDSHFEGMGDALWNYETGQLFGGYGFRTSPEVYATIEKQTGQKVTTFELKDERFYHLDTCLSILKSDCAAYVEEAFTDEGLVTLKQSFAKLIRVPLAEATKQLACNMCTPNGKDVILQKGAKQTVQSLQSHGFNVIELETSEYIKSGGSVFCMKMLLWD